MSSTDMSNRTARLSCTFCVDDDDVRKLETLVEDVDRLQFERNDLLRQNVSCKTDIKKLKDR